MEYFRGKTILQITWDIPSSLLHCNGILPPEKGYLRTKSDIFIIAKGIVAGLTALHDRGVVHNDLKPDNILIDSDSNNQLFCVLTDFGISQDVTSQILKIISSKHQL